MFRNITKPQPVAALLALCAASGACAQNIDWSDGDALRTRIESGAYGTVTSALIERDGEILFEAYFNGADAETRHNTRSVTKTITGMMVGLAIEDGYLTGVDQPAAAFFEDVRPFTSPDPRKDSITIEDLLTMSSAVECDDWNSISRGQEERMYIVHDWSRFYWDLPIRGFPAWESPPAQRMHGRAFSYCTAGVQLLGEIVERAAGRPFEDYTQERLFDPVGVADPDWSRAASGVPHLGGGLGLRTRDLAALASLYLNAGTHNGEQVLDSDWVAASLESRAEIGDGVEYGYLWWRSQYEANGSQHWMNYMTGNGGNRVAVLPDHGLVVVLTKTDYNSRDMHERTEAFFEDVVLTGIAD